MIAGEGFKNVMRHSHTTANNFEKLLTQTLDGLPQVTDQVEKLSKTELNVKQILDLAEQAASLRWKHLPEHVNDFTFDYKEPETGLYFTLMIQFRKLLPSVDMKIQGAMHGRLLTAFRKAFLKVALIFVQSRIDI